MYIILVYDVDVSRVNKVCKYLKRYLHWTQNSVFEGEITPATLEKLKAGLKKILDPEVDSIYIYKLRDRKWMEKEVVGQARSLTDRII